MPSFCQAALPLVLDRPRVELGGSEGRIDTDQRSHLSLEKGFRGKEHARRRTGGPCAQLLELGLQALDLALDERLGEVGDDFPGDRSHHLLRDLGHDALRDLRHHVDGHVDLRRPGGVRSGAKAPAPPPRHPRRSSRRGARAVARFRGRGAAPGFGRRVRTPARPRATRRRFRIGRGWRQDRRRHGGSQEAEAAGRRHHGGGGGRGGGGERRPRGWRGRGHHHGRRRHRRWRTTRRGPAKAGGAPAPADHRRRHRDVDGPSRRGHAHEARHRGCRARHHDPTAPRSAAPSPR